MNHVTHIYSGDKHVAMINRSNPLASGHDPHNPWMLLRNTGRTDRFPTRAEAAAEAKKCYPAAKLSRI